MGCAYDFCKAPGRGQAIAPTMLRAGGHVVHSRGDGSSSPSSGYCFVHQDMRALQKSYAHLTRTWYRCVFWATERLSSGEMLAREAFRTGTRMGWPHDRSPNPTSN